MNTTPVTPPPRTLDPIDPDKPYGRADLRVEFALLLDKVDGCGNGERRDDTYRILGEMITSLSQTFDEITQTPTESGDAGS